MTSARSDLQLRHTALESSHGDRLAEVCLNGRERVAIVMQAAALLSHLSSAGWCLASDWSCLRVDRKGVLRGAHAKRELASGTPQAQLSSLMRSLFGGEARVPGKGQAFRIADRLLCNWQCSLRVLPVDRIVSDLLDEARFLWHQRFSFARQALIAQVPSPQGAMRLAVAGRGAFERRLLNSGRGYSQLVSLVSGDRAESLWYGSRSSAASSKNKVNAGECKTSLPRLAAGLAAESSGRLASTERELAAGFARQRRSLSERQAAEGWRCLTHLRLRQGRLAPAAKAANHAQRLAEGVDLEITDSALFNLIEVRLRQGRVDEVSLLLGPTSPLLGSRQTQSQTRFEELRARRDLVVGQPARAYRALRALEQAPAASQEYPSLVRRTLAARALGWLGRAAEARESLEGMSVEELAGLEPEEYPATWALAGDWVRARESANNSGPGALWKRVLAGDEVPDNLWSALSGLGSYRSARMIFDLQLLAPGRAPSRWLDKAVAGLRAHGADAFAERLDRTREGCWKALERYLIRSRTRNSDLGQLFEMAGYFDVRLEWRNPSGREVLVSGRGGSEELVERRSGGHLALYAENLDPTLRALFALAARDFQPPAMAAERRPLRVSGILGSSNCLMQALERLERLAETDLTVLIEGETGTGKELAARQLHRLSRRSSRPLVPINCAALSDSLLLSDLFGHVRGAFTGADRDRAGVFEAAAGGTVLLDEIGDLPLTAQGKLLRVLQEGEVRRVGESLPRKLDVRVLAATHRDLGAMVEKGTYRQDLYYRLKVSALTLPPLRDREGDVLQLAEHFMSHSGQRLTPAARHRLLQYPWPGNVRELRNVLQVATALSRNGVVDDLELPRATRQGGVGYHAQVEELRCRLVREALTASDGHRARAARRLGVSRQALSYLVKRFGLDR
jgi:DNA-binding NtrC family response regulator